MGRPREWPAEVERAVVIEVLASRRTVKDVIERLHQGRLAGVEGEYPVPKSTVYRWVDEAKRAYDETERPDAAALDDVAARLWRLHLRQLDELEALQDKAERTYQEDRTLDYSMRAALKRQVELERLHYATKPKTTTTDPEKVDGDQEQETERDFLDSLVDGSDATDGCPEPEAADPSPDTQPTTQTPREAEEGQDVESVGSDSG